MVEGNLEHPQDQLLPVINFDKETSNKPDLQWLNMCNINPNKPAAPFVGRL